MSSASKGKLRHKGSERAKIQSGHRRRTTSKKLSRGEEDRHRKNGAPISLEPKSFPVRRDMEGETLAVGWKERTTTKKREISHASKTGERTENLKCETGMELSPKL